MQQSRGDQSKSVSVDLNDHVLSGVSGPVDRGRTTVLASVPILVMDFPLVYLIALDGLKLYGKPYGLAAERPEAPSAIKFLLFLE